jgi:transketolase
MQENKNLEQLCINTIRTLSMDAVQKANSGHPGMPMGCAPMAHVLWSKFMKYNPKNPDWANRDRFVLSAGHGSMLLYSILHLTGYNIAMDDIKKFRQIGSITAGHPEHGLTPGVETTTGPLGQGFANGVGFAIAQKFLAARFNKPDYPIFDYNIYGIVSDGDLMEGISAESASFAGFLKLGNLIYLYDDNHISIEGKTEITFTDDTAKRFESYGWHVQQLEDGNDVEAIAAAIKIAKDVTDKPSLIKIRTHIAYGSPNKHDSAGAHGSPLGEDEVRLTKEFYGCDPDKHFYVPDEVYNYYRSAIVRGKEQETKWNELYNSYRKEYTDEAKEYELAASGDMDIKWEEVLPLFKPEEKAIETRKASSRIINAIAPNLPLFIGGSADLSPSTDTIIKDGGDFSAANYSARNFHFGIREHSMGAELNGMNLTKGITAYGSTFLIFSDYMKPSIRLAAIMKIRPIYVFTHDSIALGEDGTTHQPIEQLSSLRAIPNITVIRPADANETAYAWKAALEHKDGPVAIILTRQKVPVIDQSKFASAENLQKGAYVLSDSEGNPDIIIIATGSEVQLALDAQQKLSSDDINASVVSMPSWELFEKQTKDYKDSVLLPSVKKRLAVEAASPMGWSKYTGDEGDTLTIEKFGESAPGEDIMKAYGFTVEEVVSRAKKLLQR